MISKLAEAKGVLRTPAFLGAPFPHLSVHSET